MITSVRSFLGTSLADYLGRAVGSIALVGGGSAFPGIAEVVQEYSGIPTSLPGNPLFMTPLGMALEHPAR